MILFWIVILSIPATLVCGSVFFAARSAPRARYDEVPRSRLVRGVVLASFGLAVMAFFAWSTHEDQPYDDFGTAVTVLAGVIAGALLILGLGPVIAWLLGVLGRSASPLPPAIRPAVRPMADKPARIAAGVTTTMAATAVAVAVVILSVAVTAKARADYRPVARLGALVVEGFSPERAAAVREAVVQEFSGAPVVQNNSRRERGYFTVETADHSFLQEIHIGDQALLHYLTGDPSTPYDQKTVVVLAAGGETQDSMVIRYERSLSDPSTSVKTVPAVTVRPAEPRVGSVFIPAKIMEDFGFHLESNQLIIDPSLHRTSAIEEERLSRRLGATARVQVERGYHAPTGWQDFVAVVLLIALAGALTTTRSAASRRILRRVGGGSTAALRYFVACRAAFGAALGAGIGAVAGCVIGLLLAWPMTAPIGWDVPPRVPFETPWLLIAAFVVALPVLAAMIAGVWAAVPGRRELSP